jgi:hypothetical protein
VVADFENISALAIFSLGYIVALSISRVALFLR